MLPKPPEAPLSAKAFVQKKKELNQAIQDEMKAKGIPANDPKALEFFHQAAQSLDAMRPELVNNPDGKPNPEALESLAWLIWFWRQAGNIERRLDILERSWNKRNLPPELRIQFGIERAGIRFEQGKMEEGGQRLKELWDDNLIPKPHHFSRALEGSRLLLYRPSGLLEGGKPTEAGSAYQAVAGLASIPDDLRGMIAIDWSERLGRRKMPGAARRVLDDAWERNDIPAAMRAHIGAARALQALEMGDARGADDALKAIETDKDLADKPDVRAQGMLLWISGLAHRDRKAEAVAALDRLLSTHPENLKGPEAFKVLNGILTAAEMSGAATKGFQCIDAAIAQADREMRERSALAELCAFHMIELGSLDEARKRIERIEKEFGKDGGDAVKRLQYKMSDPSYSLIGQAPPPIDVQDAAGKAISWIDLKGQAVLLLFWSPDSDMSRRELPVLAGIANDLGPRGLQVIAVCLTKDRPSVEKFMNSKLPGRHVYADPDGALTKAFRLPGVPQSFIVDRGGIIRRIGLRGDMLRAAASEALGAQEPPAPSPPKDAPAPPPPPPAPAPK